jgi:hypothetical protein
MFQAHRIVSLTLAPAGVFHDPATMEPAGLAHFHINEIVITSIRSNQAIFMDMKESDST